MASQSVSQLRLPWRKKATDQKSYIHCTCTCTSAQPGNEAWELELVRQAHSVLFGSTYTHVPPKRCYVTKHFFMLLMIEKVSLLWLRHNCGKLNLKFRNVILHGI